MNPSSLNGNLFLFPVRHHSPTAARLVREAILRYRPEIVLVEGPSDFNPAFSELHLDHELPIAIYSFARLPDGRRRGAYYPFCEYSPEWQAIRTAREIGVEARFIDLPWSDLADESDEPSHRYADGHIARSRYVEMLCKRSGVENFDALWDAAIESQTDLNLNDYLLWMNRFCVHLRILEGGSSTTDRRREAFMAEQIRAEMQDGPVLVVIGGYHVSALHARLIDDETTQKLLAELPDLLDPKAADVSVPNDDEQRGIALTPYSYERLDSLTGYESGMPSPGFYDRVWRDRLAGRPVSHEMLLSDVVADLRRRKQTASTADLIAVKTTAAALASIRGRRDVWRNDLIDGVLSALVKDDVSLGCDHPFLDAVHAVLRGEKRGRLAFGTKTPPLVDHVRCLLKESGLEPKRARETAELDLFKADDLTKSRLLHRLSILKIPGFEQDREIDFYDAEHLDALAESWSIRHDDDFHAMLIEASIYGSTLEDAVTEKLLQESKAACRDAALCGRLLLQASLAGLERVDVQLRKSLKKLVETDGDFLNVAPTLEVLFYLYRYDNAIGTAKRTEYRELFETALERSLWLLESIGCSQGKDEAIIHGVVLLRDVFLRCETELNFNRDYFFDVFRRIEKDPTGLPALRGAASGLLWTLGKAHAEETEAVLKLFTDPDRFGDFLTGLFGLARETVQRHPDLLRCIDALMMRFFDEEFLEALPSLRLAFSWFTPREKHHLALTLVEPDGDNETETLARFESSPEEIAAAMALESKVHEFMQQYGIRQKQTH